MKKKLEEGIPVLGICFGHQLMADAYGCIVDKVQDNKYNEGSRSYTILENAFGLEKGEQLHVMTSHGYEIKSLTEDFIHLGESSECKYDVIAHKNFPFISLQGHPEASPFFVEELERKPDTEHQNLAMRDGLEVIGRFLRYSQKSH